MKQIDVQVRSERVGEVARLAERHGAFAPSHHRIEVEGEGGGWSHVTVTLPNRSFGAFVADVGDAIEDAGFVLPTSEVVPIRTPIADVRDRATDVSRRSTLELVLAVHRSIGTWKVMLLYALVSGAVAAYAVIFDLSFLLIGAMLIAPVGAPVMVLVVGITVGDLWMVRRGALRFAVALVVMAIVAAVLGVAYGLHQSTAMMETLTSLSTWSALLGIAGGAAGAQALVRTEGDSLVTATATGFLVAVSLSPPAAVLGLAASLGRWDYVALMTFLILLTLAGILAGGWLGMRLQGVVPERTSAGHGGSTRQWVLAGVAIAAVVGLVAWQTQQGPAYRKADIARSAERVTREAIATVHGYRVLSVAARFTTGEAGWHVGEGLLLTVVVKDTGDAPSERSAGDASEVLRRAVRERVASSFEDVRPFVDLSVVPR